MINRKLKKTILLDLLIKDDRWLNLHLINHENIEKMIFTMIQYLKLNTYFKQIECSIFLINDIEISSYNKKFRNKHTPTNTLSFPIEDISPFEPEKTLTANGYINLGDIFLSLETIILEASEQTKNFYDHFYHLLLHSLLHLLGYQHDEEKDRIIMENVEIHILADLNIQNPYE